jgi:aldose 1-epimerase
MKYSQGIFGHIHGVDALLFTLENDHGVIVKMTNYGATILSVQTPDKAGNQAEITLCYNNIEELASTDGRPYFGCTVGRFANRICNGSFKLNGSDHKVAVNNGLNHLHGGIQGFDQKFWDYKVIERDDSIGLEYTYYSPHGEENYPGNLKVSIVTISFLETMN